MCKRIAREKPDAGWRWRKKIPNLGGPVLFTESPMPAAENLVNAPEFTVSELSSALKRTVEDRFGFVRVRGEISGYRGPHASGHCYFALKDEDWDRVIDSNLKAVHWGCQIFGRHMASSGGGAIVNIASVSSSFSSAIT